MPDNEMILSVQGFPIRRGGYLPRSIQGLQILGQWQQDRLDSPDLWLRSEIAIAFKQMVMLRLGNTPAVEMLPFTAETWVETIGEGMTEQLDRERIKQGFKQLYRTLKWWPQPAELLKVLPRRIAPPPSPTVRAAEEADVDTSADAAKLQDILDQLEKKEQEARNAPEA